MPHRRRARHRARPCPCRPLPDALPERPTRSVRHYARISGKPGQADVFLLIYRQRAPTVRLVSSAGYCTLLQQPLSLPPPPSLRRQKG